jgi:hypothetical protein
MAGRPRLAGISCGSVCTASHLSGTEVTLTAVPGRGAKFDGWAVGGAVAPELAA